MTMHRRQFVKIGCTCMIVPWVPSLLGCEGTRHVTGTLESTGISVLKSEFDIATKGGTAQREYIIVRNDKLEYPICLYRLSENDYSAILMKCTHQGTELQVAGDHLHCPGHGSEFNNKGQVTLGPAESSLRTFRVFSESPRLVIELK